MTVHAPARPSLAARLRDPLLVGAGGFALAALLHVRDPHESGSWGYCPSYFLTGVECPGCGGLRAVNLLTRGDVVGAVSSNALAVGLVGLLAVMWVVWFVRRARGDADARMLRLGQVTAWVVLGVVVAFWVFRLTPWGAWFQP